MARCGGTMLGILIVSRRDRPLIVRKDAERFLQSKISWFNHLLLANHLGKNVKKRKLPNTFSRLELCRWRRSRQGSRWKEKWSQFKHQALSLLWLIARTRILAGAMKRPLSSCSVLWRCCCALVRDAKDERFAFRVDLGAHIFRPLQWMNVSASSSLLSSYSFTTELCANARQSELETSRPCHQERRTLMKLKMEIRVQV